jgi:DNA-binding MarR family transcriptional regulator
LGDVVSEEKPSADLLRLDAQFCFPLYAATNLITRAYRPLLKPLGLTYPQYLVMLVLWEQPSLTVKALGQRLLLDSGTLSPLLQRLEGQRLVKKQTDPDDARRVIVGITAKGEALRAKAMQVPEALMCRLLQRHGPVTANEAATLHGLQQQLRALIGLHAPAPGVPGEDDSEDDSEDTTDVSNNDHHHNRRTP